MDSSVYLPVNSDPPRGMRPPPFKTGSGSFET